MARYLLTLTICYAIFCVSCQTRTYPSPKVALTELPRFVASDKPLFTPPEGQAYTFGYLEVAESPQSPNSGIIRLPVYRMKSRNPNPAPDPVIFLTGGPGTSAMYNAPYMNYWQYLDERDVILFEQRGTLYAQPHLGCPEWGKAQKKAYALYTDPADFPKADSLMRIAAKACRDRLTGQGVNLNAYHTEAIAKDIDALCEVWQIEQCNLLSLSYGTKIAQVLARDYSERIRSIVMSGPLPLEVSWEEENLQNLYETFQQILADCASDSACNAAFPELGPRFIKFLEEITLQPLELEVSPMDRKKKRTYRLRGRDVALMLSELNTSTISRLPLYAHQILTGDYSFLENSLAQLQAGNGNMMGMRISVWCAEEMPFADQNRMEEEATRYPALSGEISPVIDPEICDIWGVRPREAKENLAVKSDIPTLIISGTYDQVTPAKWGDLIKSNFSNSFHLRFPGFRHTPITHWTNPCAMRAAHAFFQQPDSLPTPACFDELPSPAFQTE